MRCSLPEEVLESSLGELLVCAGEVGLSCKECLVLVVEKSGVLLSCEEGPVVSAGKGRKRVKVEIRARDCASVATEIETCSMQKCKDIICFGDFGAVAGNNGVALAENAVSVAKKKCWNRELR